MASYIKDLSGMRYGRLTVLRLSDKKIGAGTMWDCQCDCGNAITVRRSSLVSGNTKSCGCLHRERTSLHNTEDLTSQRFGRLVAIRPTDRRYGTCVMWECKCDCGNTTYASSHNLKCGNTDSCGCLKDEIPLSAKSYDLRGKQFGLLEAIQPTDQKKRSYIIWECKCACGNTAYATASDLVHGRITSCGCTPIVVTKSGRTRDFTGYRVGSLTAVRPTTQRKNRRVVWECKCDCGNTVFVTSFELSRGVVMSCGCTKHFK